MVMEMDGFSNYHETPRGVTVSFKAKPAGRKMYHKKRRAANIRARAAAGD